MMMRARCSNISKGFESDFLALSGLAVLVGVAALPTCCWPGNLGSPLASFGFLPSFFLSSFFLSSFLGFGKFWLTRFRYGILLYRLTMFNCAVYPCDCVF